MKQIILLLFISLSLKSQNCCSVAMASSDGMSVFVKDKKFINSHIEPKKYIHTSIVGGSMIKLKASDNVDANAYFIKSKNPKSTKWLFVYQEWWGLNDYIKKQSDVFYEQFKGEVNVIALDMYDGKLATTREDAAKFMQGADEKRLEKIVNAAISFSGKKAKIASVGWCFGGGWSLKSAIIAKKQAVGSVMYYGMPVKDLEKLKLLKCDVLGLFATEEWISKQVIEEFSANMIKANKKLTYKIFEAAHAFANPSNPKFDEEKSAIAFKMAVEYLEEKFK